MKPLTILLVIAQALRDRSRRATRVAGSAPAEPAQPPQPVQSASSQPPDARPESIAPPEYGDRREGTWRIESGYRGSFVPSAGYNPFSTNGYFPEFSLAAARTLLREREVLLRAGRGVGLRRQQRTARGGRSLLDMQRLTVSLEGRMHLGPWGYAYLRVAPGAAMQHAEIDDASSPAPLEKTQWLFATDLSAGYAWLVWPRWGGLRGRAPSLAARRGRLRIRDGERLALAPGPTLREPRAGHRGRPRVASAMQGRFFRVAAAASAFPTGRPSSRGSPRVEGQLELSAALRCPLPSRRRPRRLPGPRRGHGPGGLRPPEASRRSR